MTKFFTRLSYSFGNEDSQTERKALKVKPEDRILCITASGDRPLHLLIDDCKEVVALDANPVQNFLLSLKAAALKNLDYQEYLSFLGALPDDYRIDRFQKISTSMDSEAADYWHKNHKLIKKGILYQGGLERDASKMASVMLFLRKKKLRKLFQFENLEEQRAFVNNKWNTFFWRKAIAIALNPSVLRWFFVDPQLYISTSSLHAPSYIYERLTYCLHNNLARENSLFSLLFRGFVEKEAYPCYLKEEETKRIRKGLNKITIKTAELVTFLEQSPAGSFDCYSLSDVASYMNQDQFNRLIKAILKTSKPGARFSIRQVLSNHSILPEYQQYFQRDHLLEKQLEREDRSFIYRFQVGQVVK